MEKAELVLCTTLRDVPTEQSGIGSATQGTVRQLGGAPAPQPSG